MPSRCGSWPDRACCRRTAISVEPASAVAAAVDMQQDLHRGRQLGVQCGAIEPADDAQRLEPGGYFGGAVRVHGARSTVVPSVERAEQVDDLGTPDLTDDDPIGPHPERLADQLTDRNLARAFDIGGARNQVTRCGCGGASSAASSTQTMRSVAGTAPSRAESRVVLPAPVLPDTRNASRAAMTSRKNVRCLRRDRT